MTMTMTLNEAEQSEAAKQWLEEQGYTVIGQPLTSVGPDGKVEVTASVEPKSRRKRTAAAE